MKSLKQILKEQSSFIQEHSHTNKSFLYSDLSAIERKELDDYCNKNYGNSFLGCSFEEQSAVRSIIWAEKEDPDEIEKQDNLNKKF
jgi:hypothetical protein